MVYNCRRCRREKWRGELRKGSKTGANALKYTTLKGEINSSRILQIEKGNILCPRCLRELEEWIKAEGGPHRLAPLTGVQINQGKPR